MKLKWIICLFVFSVIAESQTYNPSGWKIVQEKQRFFQKKPVAEVANEKVILNWETVKPTSNARVHYGIVPLNYEFEIPEYRYSSTEKDDRMGWRKRHSAELKLDKIFRYMGDDWLNKDGFTLYYRIETWSPEWNKPVYWDDRVYIRTEKGKVEKGVTITEGPYIDCIFDKSAVISWNTDVPSSGIVYLSGGLFRKQFKTEAPGIHHEVRLKGLKPDREYTYFLKISDSTGNEYQTRSWVFRSETEKADSFSFVVLSDSRGSPGGGFYSNFGSNQAVLGKLRDIWLQKPPAFIVFGGDLISGFSHDPTAMEEQYFSWKRLLEPLAHFVPIYEVPGNHEMSNYLFVQEEDDSKRLYVNRKGEEGSEALFSAQFVNPLNSPPFEGKGMPDYGETAYSFQYNNTLIVAINTYYNVSTDPSLIPGNIPGNLMLRQLRWLEENLKTATKKGVKHIFVIGHHPGFPNGGHVGDSMWWNNSRRNINQMRDRFWEILSKYRVDAYFCGHEHAYNRMKIDASLSPNMTSPVYQIITGRAGAPFYTQDKNVPWKDKVEKFSIRNHYLLVTVEGEHATVKAIDVNGNIFDEFEIDE